jgi:O-antigen/teichoic acid export membrane protein
MLGNSLMLFLSKVFGYGIRILLPMALVRLLTRDDFGAYNQFFLLEVFIQTLFQTGAIQSLFFFVPRDQRNAGGYLVTSLMLNLTANAVAYTIVWNFKARIAQELGMDIIHAYFWHLAAYSTLVILNVMFETYCAARQRFVASSIMAVMKNIVATIVTLVAAFMFGDLDKIFLALIIGRGVTALGDALYVHFRLDGFRSDRYFIAIREQVRYGIVLGVGGSIGTLALKLHEMAISRNFDLGDYAIYAAGMKQIPVMQFFGQSVAAVALGQFAQLVKDEDWDGVRRLWERILATMYGVAVPFVAVFVAFAGPIVRFMFTSEYMDAVSIYRVNTLTTFALVLNATLVLRAMDRNDVTLKVNIAHMAVLPFALWIGLRQAGMDGVITAHVLLLLLNRVVAQYWLNRLTPVRLPYIASRRDLARFYAEAWGRRRAVMGRVLRRR